MAVGKNDACKHIEREIDTYVALGRLFGIRDHILPAIEQLANSSQENEFTRMDMRPISELFGHNNIGTGGVREVAGCLSDAIAKEEESLRQDMGAIDELRTLMFIAPDKCEALIYFLAFNDFGFMVQGSRFCCLNESWHLCISKVLARS